MKSVPLLFVLLTLSASPARAEDSFTLEWSNITGGALMANAGSGEFTLEGTVGQWGATAANGGPPGEFSITGGYWTFTLNESLDLGLAMQIGGGGVSLTWDDSAGISVVLERSTDLALWSAVSPPVQHPPVLDSTGPRRFYRLMIAQ